MTKFIFTCEHGGNLIPDEFSKLFKSHSSLLNSHRGYDIGILDIFKTFTKHFNSPGYYNEISRLLIELNRSPHHKNLFYEITKQLDVETKQTIINKYYLPYRTKVEQLVQNFIKSGHNVIHISFHSFTPKLNGILRKADIGLLYDPKSKKEQGFCKRWKEQMLNIAPNLNIRFNYPYLGIADGFTTFLRKKYGKINYVGIELEINQILLNSTNNKRYVSELLVNSFEQISITIS